MTIQYNLHSPYKTSVQNRAPKCFFRGNKTPTLSVAVHFMTNSPTFSINVG